MELLCSPTFQPGGEDLRQLGCLLESAAISGLAKAIPGSCRARRMRLSPQNIHRGGPIGAQAMPLSVSIVTPSYNQGRFLERTIRSVLAQRDAAPAFRGPFEYLVMDGGSRDESVEILKRYSADLQWVSEKDRGQADAVNKGLARATGEIIGWLNSDDIFYPGALAAAVDFFARRPDIDVVYGNGNHIDERDGIIEPYPTEDWDFERLKERCFLCQPAVFFRRRVVERFGPLGVQWHYALDYEYWLRLGKGGARFARIERGAGRLAAARRNQNPGSAGEGPRRDQRHAAVPVRPGARPLAVQLRPRRAGRLGRAAPEPALFSGGLGAGVVVGPAVEPSAAQPQHGEIGGSAAMRIGFDVSQTGAGAAKAGCGYYAEGLIRALEALGSGHEYFLYPAFGDLFWDPLCATAAYRTGNPAFHRLKAPGSFEESQRFWRHPGADFEARIGSPDIVHSNNFFCPRGLRRARLVYTLHDLSFLVDPSWSTEANRVGCLDGVFRAATSADWIVTNSEYTRRHFLEVFPHYPAERTEVVYPGSRYALDGPARRASPSDSPSLGCPLAARRLLALGGQPGAAQEPSQVGGGLCAQRVEPAAGAGWRNRLADGRLAPRRSHADRLRFGCGIGMALPELLRVCVPVVVRGVRDAGAGGAGAGGSGDLFQHHVAAGSGGRCRSAGGPFGCRGDCGGHDPAGFGGDRAGGFTRSGSAPGAAFFMGGVGQEAGGGV